VTSPQPTPPEPPTGRPEDVDTGFWLWVAALPLLVVGYVSDVVTTHVANGSAVVYLLSGLFVFVLTAVVVTFLILMRAGYRWARTLLTGGGLAAIVSVVSGLFSVERTPVGAFTYAITGIVGGVLIAGGIVLLHRKDAQAFFTR
jgi:hypothetical protein